MIAKPMDGKVKCLKTLPKSYFLLQWSLHQQNSLITLSRGCCDACRLNRLFVRIIYDGFYLMPTISFLFRRRYRDKKINRMRQSELVSN